MQGSAIVDRLVHVPAGYEDYIKNSRVNKFVGAKTVHPESRYRKNQVKAVPEEDCFETVQRKNNNVQ